MLKLCKIYASASGPLGLHLSRAPWDPYPWVSEVQKGSSAHASGIRSGDTVLELNGSDVLGKKISEIAAHIREHWQSGANYITVIVWRNKVNDCGDGKHNHRSHRSTTAAATGTQSTNGSTSSSSSTSSSNSSDADDDVVDECEDDAANANSDDDDDDDDCDANAHTVNQRSLQKFATCLQNIAQLLECPICLEVVKPPGWQCCNGHVLCNNCRSRSVKCPVCRVPLGPRGRCLLSDKLFTLLAESFPCDRAATPKERGSKARAKQKSTPQQIELHNREKTSEQQKSKDAKLKTQSLLQQHQQRRHEGKLNKIEWQQQHQQASKPDVARPVSLAKEMSELRLAGDVGEDKLQAGKDVASNLRMLCKTAEKHNNNNNNKAGKTNTASEHSARFIYFQRGSRMSEALQQQ